MVLEDLQAKARSHFDKGQWERAAEVYGQLIRSLESTQDDRLLAEAHLKKGHAEMRISNYPRAMHHFNEALVILRAIDDQAGAADALRGLGYVHWQTGDYDLSARRFKDALQRAAELEDRALMGKVKIEQGNLLNFQGELESAEEEYRDAISLLGAARDKAEEARAHNNLGDALYRMGRHREAIEEFKVAIRLGEDADHMSRVAWARSNCALCLIEVGQVALAKDYILLARDYMERIGDKIGIGDTREALGLAYMEEGKFEEAERELRAGLGIGTELNVPDRKAIAERNLARLYIKMGRASNARSHLSRALSLFEGIGMRLEAERARDMLDGLEGKDEE